MIEFKNGGRLVQSPGELPNLKGARCVYIDFETTGKHPKIRAVNPWMNCWVAGVAIAADSIPGAWYIPIAHAEGFGPNLDSDTVIEWLADILDSAEVWCNHNVKFDVHLAHNDLGIDTSVRLRCTLAGAKIINSDMMFSGGYGLDNLSKQWLGEDISHAELAMQPYLGKHNCDYGAVPVDLMGEYACQDVLTTRRLDKLIRDRVPDDLCKCWDVEQHLTSVLTRMERRGVVVYPQELKLMELKILDKLLLIEEQIQSLTGMYVRPNNNGDCFDLLCNHYGLPVLAKTEDNNPSFDKDALKKYLVLPGSPTDVIDLVLQHRMLGTLKSLFVEPFQALNVDGVLHPDFNQIVRTGRMSCKQPNAQQQSSASKGLIHPREGYSFLRCDYSQIEYRLIVHFIRDENAIRAYNENPDTDFHMWVANMCGMERKPAKTLNFGAGYGMGRDTTVGMISSDETIMKDLRLKVEELVESGKIKSEASLKTFRSLAKQKADSIYDKYHENLPTLKQASRAASQAARLRGYVRTLLGRRRHLPITSSHIAFNSVCQGSASDIIKERMVTLAESDILRKWDAHMLLQVHDELVFEVPTEHAQEAARDIVTHMEDMCSFPMLRVPMRCSFGISPLSWKHASLDENEQKLTIN